MVSISEILIRPFSEIDTLHKLCICFLLFQVRKHPSIFLLFYIVAMDFVAFNILL